MHGASVVRQYRGVAGRARVPARRPAHSAGAEHRRQRGLVAMLTAGATGTHQNNYVVDAVEHVLSRSRGSL